VADVNDMARRVATTLQKREAGSYGFDDWVPIKDVRKAFEYARTQAQRDHGHGGYSGTIAEKDGYKIHSRTPMSKSEARKVVNRDTDRNSKYDDALAIPYASETVLQEQEYTVKVKAKDGDAARELGEQAIAAKGRTRKGAQVSVDIGWQGVKQVKPAGAPSVTTERMNVTKMMVGDREVNDLKAAKAEAAKQLGQSYREVGSFVVIKKVQFLVKITKTGAPARLAHYEVTGTRKQIALGPVEGWVFFGMAAS
jgi:hypothetical protein